MPSSAEIVQAAAQALEEGDLLRLMGLVAKDVRWAVNAADRDAVAQPQPLDNPWRSNGQPPQ